MDVIEPATGDFEVDRQRHLRARKARIEGEYARLCWPLARLWAVRDQRLRSLLDHAKAHSSWHAERLREIDPQQVDGHDLTAIPSMTKADLMGHWDAIVTDPRLDLATANRHLERIAEGDHGYLLDEYHIVASGGSSGTRTVMAWDFEGFLMHNMSYARAALWHMRNPIDGRRSTAKPRLVMVYATNPIHISAALGRCFGSPTYDVQLLSATRPLGETVERLNALAPTNVASYPSMLHLLALEARAGRLDIQPERITSNGEPLLSETRTLVEETFAVPVHAAWGTTETAPLAHADGVHRDLVLAEDMTVVEPVDEAGRPVPPGTRAAKVLVTNVVNKVLPLIRFEITDEVEFRTRHNPGPWSGRLVAEIQGRQDDWFTYGEGRGGEATHVHPFVFRDVLGADPDVSEYRVRQTIDGAEVDVRPAASRPDAAQLARALEDALRGAGLGTPRVRVFLEASLDRHQETGKLRRFVPLRGGETAP